MHSKILKGTNFKTTIFYFFMFFYQHPALNMVKMPWQGKWVHHHRLFVKYWNFPLFGPIAPRFSTQIYATCLNTIDTASIKSYRHHLDDFYHNGGEYHWITTFFFKHCSFSPGLRAMELYQWFDRRKYVGIRMYPMRWIYYYTTSIQIVEWHLYP